MMMRDCDDLDGGVELAQPGRAKSAKAGHDVDGRRANNDEDVATDHGDCHPKRNRQVARQGLGKNAAHRKHDKRRHQHQLVGNRIEYGAELRLLIKAAGQQSVEAVCKAGDDEDSQRQDEIADRKAG